MVNSQQPPAPPSADDRRSAGTQRIVVVTQAAEDEHAVELSEILRVARLGRWWIIGAAAVLVIAAVVHVLLATRVYRAEALVTIASDSSSAFGAGTGNALGAIASLTGLDLGGDQGRRAEYIALLSSRAVLQEFMHQENLLPVLFYDRWDLETGQWRGDAPSMDEAAEYMRRRVLTVADDRRTGLVTVRVQWPDPILCAVWTNKLISFVNERVRNTTIAEARSSIEFLNREIDSTEAVGVRQASFRLIEGNLNRIMLANAQREYALRVIDPASPPDPRRFVQPRPVVEVAGALLLGGLIGFVIAWLRLHRARPQ